MLTEFAAEASPPWGAHAAGRVVAGDDAGTAVSAAKGGAWLRLDPNATVGTAVPGRAFAEEPVEGVDAPAAVHAPALGALVEVHLAKPALNPNSQRVNFFTKPFVYKIPIFRFRGQILKKMKNSLEIFKK